MRVLILSCNTGEGHNSAAKAIAEVLENRGIYYKIEDALLCFSKEISDLVCKSYVMLCKRAPRIFGAGYRLVENHAPEPGDRSAMYALLSKGGRKLYNLVVEGDYDAVISVHVFAALMLTKVIENSNMDIRSYFVPTDYTCYPGVAECNVDKVFVPHEELIPEFIQCGVHDDKLITSGIPVKQAFFRHEDKLKAREQLGLPKDKTIVLLACGSMGCGPIKHLAENLLDDCPRNTMSVAICGRNRRLYDKLSEVAKDDGNIKVIGFTGDMPLYMDAADVIVTKPGGLSSTEAATKGLPMIFVNAIPGCETHNLDFYTNGCFGETAETVDGLVQLVKKYAENEDMRTEAAVRLRKSFYRNGAEIVYNQLMNDLDGAVAKK